ncbi:sigma factor G inhibitor Gin [Clostridium estertheticum]|uniref:sigma factor G inhibitor Gin n=1 Tax=Clostridium estertheticum TaxID=238834 RepID=UPI001CF2FF27|nr:sigma factor G inhibitor Gin [Clostridium estertheticum]MCB2354960.1 sigma factor G inhibitor Gin [Clostridium estertheticum]MCB2361032.1 sigma factor G inhibitor Gin [Clostridium estertheticum]WAG41196.1 sigma factor G inhibitor Gin [Clostridium estertheticum]
MQKEKCIICRKPLNGGIIINGRGICNNCEERIIKAKANTDFYEYYKNCIRKTLVQFIPRGVTKDCQDYHL